MKEIILLFLLTVCIILENSCYMTTPGPNETESSSTTHSSSTSSGLSSAGSGSSSSAFSVPPAVLSVIQTMSGYNCTNFNYWNCEQDRNVYNYFFTNYETLRQAVIPPLMTDITNRKPVWESFDQADAAYTWYLSYTATNYNYYTNASGGQKCLYTDGGRSMNTASAYYWEPASRNYTYISNWQSSYYLTAYSSGLIDYHAFSGFYYCRWTNSDGSDYYKLIYPEGITFETFGITDYRAGFDSWGISYWNVNSNKNLIFSNGMNVCILNTWKELWIAQSSGMTNAIFENGYKEVEGGGHKIYILSNGDICDYLPDGSHVNTTRGCTVVNCYDSLNRITNTCLTSGWPYSSESFQSTYFQINYRPEYASFVSTYTADIDSTVYIADHGFLNDYSRLNKPIIVFFSTSNEFMQFFGTNLWMPGGFATGDNLIAISPYFTNWSMTEFVYDLQHEFMHNEILNILCGGCFPSWINEGIAQIAGANFISNCVQVTNANNNVKNYIANNSLLDWVYIATNSFGVLTASEADVAYDQSFSFINYIYLCYGRAKIVDFIQAFTNNNDSSQFSGEFNFAFGKDFNSLITDWENYIISLPASKVEFLGEKRSILRF